MYKAKKVNCDFQRNNIVAILRVIKTLEANAIPVGAITWYVCEESKILYPGNSVHCENNRYARNFRSKNFEFVEFLYDQWQVDHYNTIEEPIRSEYEKEMGMPGDSLYRFKTKSEFLDDGNWNYQNEKPQKNWCKDRMNKWIGHFIPASYNTNCAQLMSRGTSFDFSSPYGNFNVDASHITEVYKTKKSSIQHIGQITERTFQYKEPTSSVGLRGYREPVNKECRQLTTDFLLEEDDEVPMDTSVTRVTTGHKFL